MKNLKFIKILITGFILTITSYSQVNASVICGSSSSVSGGKLYVYYNTCGGLSEAEHDGVTMRNNTINNVTRNYYILNSTDYSGSLDKDGNLIVTSNNDPSVTYDKDTIKGVVGFEYRVDMGTSNLINKYWRYTYNPDGTLKKYITVDDTGSSMVADSIQYTYDDHKNVLTEKIGKQRGNNVTWENNTYSYTYDGDLMTSKSKNGELIETYTYTYDEVTGEVTSKSVNGEVVEVYEVHRPEIHESKRIYTVSEAEEALGKNNKNTFTLRYR